MKVLIVGNGRTQCEAMLGVLAQRDSHVEALEANTCNDALALIATHGQPDLVVLDVDAAPRGVYALQSFCQRLAAIAAASCPSASIDPAFRPELTPRQSQVLALLAQGKSNKRICRELNLAEGTVKIHVTAILKALKVANRTQAAIAAARLGLDLPTPRPPGISR